MPRNVGRTGSTLGHPRQQMPQEDGSQGRVVCMSWSITTEPEHPVLRVIVWHVLTKGDLMDMLSGIRFIARQQRVTRILCDCTELDGCIFSVGDLPNFASVIKSSELAHAFRGAMLLPASPVAARFVRLCRNICTDHCLEVRTFRSRERALDWLVKGLQHGRKSAYASNGPK